MNKKAFTISLSMLLVLSGMLVVGVNEATAEENIQTKEEGEAFFDPEIIDYSEEVELGDEVWIEYSVTNTGDASGTQDIILTVEVKKVDIKKENTHENVTLEPGEDWTKEYTYDTSDAEEEYGQDILEIEVEVDVTLETENDSDSKKATIISPGRIPGFTFLLLLLGVIFGVAAYHLKEK